MKIGLPGLVFLVLFVLKLTDHFNHSWWLVTAPLWVPSGIAVTIALFALAMAGIVALAEGRARRKRRGF